MREGRGDVVSLDVKVGDTVVVSRYGVDESIQTVTRVLKRYFLTDKSSDK